MALPMLAAFLMAGMSLTQESVLPPPPRVPLPHPLRIPHHRRVVGRDPVRVGEPVRPLDRRDPATGPLAVVRDQHQGHVGDRGARLDEALDAPTGPDELLQVTLVGVVRRAHRHPGGAGAPTAAAEPIAQTHGASVLHERSCHT